MDYDRLFHLLYPSLHRYLHRLTGDADVADDIAQEAFVRLLSQPLPEDEARPWLFTVATNLVRDRVRKSTRRDRLLVKAPPPTPFGPPPDEVAERSQRIDAVRATLEKLPERDRQLLLMREEGFKYDEMASAVGVAPSSVGTLLARALKRFAEAHKSQEVGDDARE